MGKRIDIKNKTFGNLKVLSFVCNRNTHAVWKVKCSCGKVFEVIYTNLISGNTTKCASCGQKTHDLYGTHYYRKYISLIQRQKRENIDKNWHSFKNFKEDTFSTFEEGFRLKRLDNTKPFSKENCCWQKPRIGKNKSEIIYFNE
jgi:hypothetical protein